VESCNRNANNVVGDVSITYGKSGPCTHVKAAIECSQEAQPLTLKNSILNTLQVKRSCMVADLFLICTKQNEWVSNKSQRFEWK
jgi:hypothetical protein